MSHRIREPIDSKINASWLQMFAALISLVLFAGCPDYSKLREVPDYSVMTDTGEELNPGSDFADSSVDAPEADSLPADLSSSSSPDEVARSNDSRPTVNRSAPASGWLWYLLGGVLVVLGGSATIRLMSGRSENAAPSSQTTETGHKKNTDSRTAKPAAPAPANSLNSTAKSTPKPANTDHSKTLYDSPLKTAQATGIQRTGDSFDLTAIVNSTSGKLDPPSISSTEINLVHPESSADQTSNQENTMNLATNYSDLEQRSRDLARQLDDAHEEIAQLRAKLTDKLELIEKLQTVQHSSDSVENLENKSTDELIQIITQLQRDNAKLNVQLEEQIEKKQAARAKLRKKIERIKELESES